MIVASVDYQHGTPRTRCLNNTAEEVLTCCETLLSASRLHSSPPLLQNLAHIGTHCISEDAIKWHCSV